MPKKKSRVEIPAEIAARVLFLSDRTCCVCRSKGKAVQIHHIDEDPTNNDLSNLSVLCFYCHRETMLRGGFDRKLDADQVILYRNDWLRIVATERAASEAKRETTDAPKYDIELVTSIAEIYRENQQYELLAAHYNAIGNIELRDKYVELALSQNPTDDTAFFLRAHIQRRPDLLPKDILDRHLAKYAGDRSPTQYARALFDVARPVEAAVEYVRGIHESLQEQQWFSAAFYLSEFFEKKLVDELLVAALKKATAEGNLWWQVRALQELGWRSELKALLISNDAEIASTGNITLQQLLAEAKGDASQAKELRKTMARGTRIVRPGEKIRTKSDG